MKLHTPRAGAYTLTVLDQHNSIHTHTAQTMDALYAWMQFQPEDALSLCMSPKEWRTVAGAVACHGSVRVETEYDCDLIIVYTPHPPHSYLSENRMENTDYLPGDPPVPVGAIVNYTGSQRHGRYEVIDHRDPAEHPDHLSEDELRELCPDGVAYDLWPVGLPRKFGNREQAVLHARRTSFCVESTPEENA